MSKEILNILHRGRNDYMYCVECGIDVEVNGLGECTRCGADLVSATEYRK